jgi:hypothetical protein
VKLSGTRRKILFIGAVAAAGRLTAGVGAQP